MKIRVVFRKLNKDLVGTVMHGAGRAIITIDLSAHANPARIYLHELLHIYNPDWGERRVLNEERRMWKAMSTKQKHALYQELFRKQYRSQPGDFWEAE